MQHFNYGKYKIQTAFDEKTTIELINECLNGSYQALETYKDEDHSLVVKIVFQGEHYILKVPRDRNNGFMERFRSFFRKSYARRTVESHLKAEALGFKSPEPVLLLEQRTAGVCVDSLFVYRYLDGRQGNHNDIEILAPIMVELYQKRILRGDADPSNFIIYNDSAYFIDFIFRKPIIFKRYFVAVEFLRFLEDTPEAINYLPESERNNAWFLIANAIKTLRTQLKLMTKKFRLK